MAEDKNVLSVFVSDERIRSFKWLPEFVETFNQATTDAALFAEVTALVTAIMKAAASVLMGNVQTGEGFPWKQN